VNVPGTGSWELRSARLRPSLGLDGQRHRKRSCRVGVRVGTTVTSGDVIWQPFASASVFHEFRGEVSSNLTSSFSALGAPFAPLPTLSSTVTTSGLGTYGQFGLGVARGW